jgi:ATP-dependent protease ClpP protease subunit
MANNCGMEYEKMLELCDRDYFMNPEHALELGFIDNIVGRKEDKKMESFRGAVNH